MKIQDIYIYPIKSLGGIRLEEAEVLTKGFRWDRRWMLVDESGNFLTQRSLHKMALLQTELRHNGLYIYHKQQKDLFLHIPYQPETDEFITVRVWDDTVQGQIVSQTADNWFSKVLGLPCRLVFMPEPTPRKVDLKYAKNGESVSFADAMPYLLIGQGSLDDLNQRLEKAVPMERFRPNLVFSGGLPFEEDEWKEIQVNHIVFQVAKPCARCVLTTVDQQTGVKGKEPLKTLATYRTKDKKVLFGQNLIALGKGILKVGDEIRIIRN